MEASRLIPFFFLILYRLAFRKRSCLPASGTAVLLDTRDHVPEIAGAVQEKEFKRRASARKAPPPKVFVPLETQRGTKQTPKKATKADKGGGRAASRAAKTAQDKLDKERKDVQKVLKAAEMTLKSKERALERLEARNESALSSSDITALVNDRVRQALGEMSPARREDSPPHKRHKREEERVQNQHTAELQRALQQQAEAHQEALAQQRADAARAMELKQQELLLRSSMDSSHVSFLALERLGVIAAPRSQVYTSHLLSWFVVQIHEAWCTCVGHPVDAGRNPSVEHPASDSVFETKQYPKPGYLCGAAGGRPVLA